MYYGDSLMNTSLYQKAWQKREALFDRCEAEQTNCYRVFHGTAEGMPGVTVDRYGPQLLVQSFHRPVSELPMEALLAFYRARLPDIEHVAINDRSASSSRRARHATDKPDVELGLQAQELGVQYRVAARHEGEDPLLFLDLRVARRWILQAAKDLRVLNLFAYTAGAGVCAALGGAAFVTNVDFSQFALRFAAENFTLNTIAAENYTCIEADCFAALRQFAGQPALSRVRKGRRVNTVPRQPSLTAQQFDLVILDPPAWAKSPFGTVDLVRDYQSVFKPAIQVLAEGGKILACNNVARVKNDEWCDLLQRCAKKAGRPIRDIEVLTPEEDFPSFDGQHPLKIAICAF